MSDWHNTELDDLEGYAFQNLVAELFYSIATPICIKPRSSERAKVWLRILSALLILAWSGDGQARTWHVPADAPTVQAGIDSAQSGDDVLLAPGTYTYTSEAASGSSMIHMKSGIWLHSTAGAEFTILDAQGLGRVMRLNEVGDTTHIEGLTLTGGVPVNDFEGSGGGYLHLWKRPPHRVRLRAVRQQILWSWGDT